MVEEGPNQLNERSFIPRKHVILVDFFIENIHFSYAKVKIDTKGLDLR